MISKSPKWGYSPSKWPFHLRAGLIKVNQWFISPDHKALFLGGGTLQGGRLTGHKLNVNELLLGTVCWICFLDDFLMDSISWDSSQSNNHLGHVPSIFFANHLSSSDVLF